MGYHARLPAKPAQAPSPGGWDIATLSCLVLAFVAQVVGMPLVAVGAFVAGLGGGALAVRDVRRVKVAREVTARKEGLEAREEADEWAKGRYPCRCGPDVTATHDPVPVEVTFPAYGLAEERTEVLLHACPVCWGERKPQPQITVAATISVGTGPQKVTWGSPERFDAAAWALQQELDDLKDRIRRAGQPAQGHPSVVQLQREVDAAKRAVENQSRVGCAHASVTSAPGGAGWTSFCDACDREVPTAFAGPPQVPLRLEAQPSCEAHIVAWGSTLCVQCGEPT